MAWLVSTVWVISWATERKDYSNYLGEEVEISRHWATAHVLVLMARLATFTALLRVHSLAEVLREPHEQ